MKAKAKASAVALAIHSDDESDNESFCSDVSTVSEVSKGCLVRHEKHKKITKDKKLKFNNNRDIIKFHVPADRQMRRTFPKKRIGNKVPEKELKDKN